MIFYKKRGINVGHIIRSPEVLARILETEEQIPS